MKLLTIILRFLIVLSLVFFSTTDLQAKCHYKQIINGEEISVGIMLSWSTSLEQDNAMFIIERSNDGIQFTNIGAVKGAGHSIKNNDYSFLDDSKSDGQRYYRLRQIDFDGSFSTSPIFIFNKNAPAFFHISNMSSAHATNQLEIQFEVFQPNVFQYDLMDWQGKSLLVNSSTATEGPNTIKIDLSPFEDLIYQLTLRTIEEEQTITFRKFKSMLAL